MKLELETERLLLRPFRLEDAPAMFSGWASDAEVTKYLTWPPHRDVETTRQVLAAWVREYEKPERLNFAIVLKEEDALIGGIDVVGYLGGVDGTPVIGYAMAKAYWNRGYMTEACRRVLELLFSRGYPRVRIDAQVENARSNRVIEKCGGRFLATEEEHLPLKNETVLVKRYVVERGEGDKNRE